MEKTKTILAGLLGISMLCATLRCDFYCAEEIIDDSSQTTYCILHDYHVSHPGVTYKQRYDFLKSAYQLDAACTIEDGFINFFVYGSIVSRLFLDGSALASLDAYCKDLGIPSNNVEFRTIRFWLDGKDRVSNTFFGEISGKDIMAYAKNAIVEIKTYNDGEQANKLYKDEVEAYEVLMRENKEFFDYLDQDVPYKTLIQNIDSALCIKLIIKIFKTYFLADLENAKFDGEETKIHALKLFDFPLIDLKLLHYSLNQGKKYRIIAAGGVHAQRISSMFEKCLGFKKGRTFGNVSQNDPLNLEDVFAQLADNRPIHPEPTSYLMKALKLRTKLDQTRFAAWVNTGTLNLLDLTHIGLSYLVSKQLCARLFKKSSLVTELAGAGVLYTSSLALLYARAFLEARNKYPIQNPEKA